MLVKGSARGGAADLARHLRSEENEKALVIGVYGIAARDLEGALMEMDALGAGLRTRRTLYHMSINPEPGKDREMKGADWDFAEAAALKKMGLENQPYVIVEHEKIGKDGEMRRHRHLIVSRADLEHNRAIRCDHNYRKHEELSRELEQYLGHDRVQGVHVERDGPRPDRTPSYGEMQQQKRTGISRDAAKQFITRQWQTTDSGVAVKAALEAENWLLARGDKTTANGRAYLIVIDPQGGMHELARRVEGVKAAAVHARMADLDPASLPSVAEAKAQQQARIEQERQHQPEQQQTPAAAHAPNRFEAGAARVTEPRSATYDRDAADAAWTEKVSAAGIENEAQRTAETTRQRREQGKGIETPAAAARGDYAELQPPSPATPSPAPERSLSKTAGEIRAAWSLTRAVGDLGEALAARGITLAQVTPEEARASTRATARGEYAELKPEPGPYSPLLRSGEIVAVDRHGGVYPLNERTTGDRKNEIAARIAKTNRDDEMLSVTDAKEAMRAAARADSAAQRQAERDKARPVTAVEQKILWADRLADERNSFAALSNQAGIALVRVTARDVQALAALRSDAALVATTNDGEDRIGTFQHVREGELAAVTRQGNVLRVNQQHLAEIGQREGANLPSVTEARAAFEIDNEARKTVRQEIRAGLDEDRDASATAHVERMEKAEDRQEIRAVTSRAERAVHTLIEGAAKTRTAAHAVGSLAAAVTKVLGGVFEFLVGGSPKLTRQQVHQRHQAAGNIETQHIMAVDRYTAKVEAERAERIERADSDQQAPLAAPAYFRTVTRPADPAERRLHEQQHGHERERER